MIRLTHQFDPAYARASAASPKSGGCSCCCCSCCVATALGGSVFTARAIRSPLPPVVLAQVESHELPPAASSTELPTPPAKLWRWRIFGFLLLPLPFTIEAIIDGSTRLSSCSTARGLEVWLCLAAWTLSAIAKWRPTYSIGVWLAGLAFLAITKRIKWSVALAIPASMVGISIVEAYFWLHIFVH